MSLEFDTYSMLYICVPVMDWSIMGTIGSSSHDSERNKTPEDD